jgi:O-6-methylguanine DNA methyltransferase
MKNLSRCELISCFIDHPVTAITVFVKYFPNNPRIVGVNFGRRGSFRGETAVKTDMTPMPDFLRHVKAIFTGFLDGKEKDLSSLPIDLTGLTVFSRKTLLAARSIPWGRTVSYAELAKRAGSPGAVRAVASAMRNNPMPLIIPCHRVIKSDGSIGGFMGKSSGRSIRLKKRLLEGEGILID